MKQNLVIRGQAYNQIDHFTINKRDGGTATFVDTSDADALASDISIGKTAYVQGTKVIGTGAGGGAMVLQMEMINDNVVLDKTYTQVAALLQQTCLYFVLPRFNDFNIPYGLMFTLSAVHTADNMIWLTAQDASNSSTKKYRLYLMDYVDPDTDETYLRGELFEDPGDVFIINCTVDTSGDTEEYVPQITFGEIVDAYLSGAELICRTWFDDEPDRYYEYRYAGAFLGEGAEWFDFDRTSVFHPLVGLDSLVYESIRFNPDDTCTYAYRRHYINDGDD